MLERARAAVHGAERRLPPRRAATGSTPSRTGSRTRSSATSCSSTCPSGGVVLRYLAEFARVLSPEGSAFVQLPVLRRAASAPRLAARPHASRVPLSAVFRARRHRPSRLPRARGSRKLSSRTGCAAAGLRAAARDESPDVALPLRARGVPAAGARRVTPLVLVALRRRCSRSAAVAVWRRPIVALYVFIVGLALHNLVLALLYDAGAARRGDRRRAGVEGGAARRGRRARGVRRDPRAPAALPPAVVDWLALAFAAVVCLYALIPQDVLDGEAGAQGHPLRPPPRARPGRRVLPRPLADPRPRSSCAGIGWTLLGGGRRARRRRARSTSTPSTSSGGAAPAPSATSATSSASTTTAPAACPTTGRSTPRTGCSGGSSRASSARSRRRSRSSSRCSSPASPGRTAVAGRSPSALVALCAAALLFTLSRSSLLALAGAFVVLAVALRRWWPVVGDRCRARGRRRLRLRLHVCRARDALLPGRTCPYQEEQARKHGDLPGGSSLALNPGEPSLRSHWRSLRDGIETVFEHPAGLRARQRRRDRAFASACRSAPVSRTTRRPASRRGSPARCCSSRGASRCSSRSCARRGLPTDATYRVAAAGAAAALAAVLALAVQTDAYGVPWLAYCLWWLCGSLVEPAAVPFVDGAAADPRVRVGHGRPEVAASTRDRLLPRRARVRPDAGWFESARSSRRGATATTSG